jgi:oligopeptide transport system substrate-binding protein
MEQVTQIFLRQPYVIGMVDDALGVTPPDDWANIYIAQH